MPRLRNFFFPKTFSAVLVTLLGLSTLLPLTRESLPASSASNSIIFHSTITSAATDYEADTPASGPLLSSGAAATYYIDLRNSPSSASSLENIVLKTKNLSSWTGTPVCQYVTTSGSFDHTTFDFDLSGASCSLGGSYIIAGASLPTSLAPDEGIYVRITGLSVGSSTISMTATVNAGFTAQPAFTSKDPAYARVGSIIITGHVFNDLNGDGVNATPDVDYEGLGMDLWREPADVGFGTFVGTKTTDENGYYSFNELDTPSITAGQDYRVVSLATINRLTTGNNIQQIPSITSSTNVTTDIGFHIPQQSLVGNRVWEDTNHDGIQDSGETNGVGDTRLRLFNANSDAVLDTITSAGNGTYKLGNDPANPQCFGRNINQAGGSIANTIVSYSCQVQAGGQYYLTLRTDFYCSADQSAFRLYDAGNNVLTEGSCGRTGYPNNMLPKHNYTFGPFTETHAGIPHLDVIDGFGDFTFTDVNWQYNGPIGYDAYVVIDQIPVSYQISPADQTDDSLDSDITTPLLSGTEYRTDNFFFQLDNLNQNIDIGLYGPPPATTDLTITKTVSAPTTALGDTVTYTITVTNTSSATNVIVNDMLPAALNYSAQNASVGSYSVGSGNWVIGDMAASSSEILTIDAVISDVSGTITNTATVTSDTAEVNATDNSAAVEVSPTAPPPSSSADLEIIKTADAPDPQLGNTITYSIAVTNTSLITTATGVVVTDLLPASVSYTSQSASVGTYVPGTGEWIIGDITPGSTSTLTLDVTITDDSTKINNTATVTSSTFDPANTNDSSTVSTTPTTPPPPGTDTDMLITKSVAVSPSGPSLGSTATYTITVTNQSLTTAATGVVVTDVLPSALTLVSQSATTGFYKVSTHVWSIGSMGAGTTEELTITTTINNTSSEIFNTASVTSTTTDPTPGNNSDTVSFIPTDTPLPSSTDLSITKTVDAPTPLLGSTATYTITVTNQSLTTAATGVVVTDVLPSALTLVSQSATTGFYKVSTHVWSIGSMGAGTTEELTITTTINNTSSEIFNTASVTSTTTDPTPGNNSDTVSFIPTDTPPPSSTDLSITKTVDAPTPLLGSTATYTIIVTNNSAVTTATGVVGNDTLPSSVTYVTQTATSGTYNNTSGTWDIGSITPGATATLTITTTINDDSGTINNTATVTSTTSDPSSSNNSSTATFTPTTPPPAPEPSADLSITKTATAPDPQLGGTIIYELTVTNNSIVNASDGVVVMDTLPSGVHFESASLSVGTRDSNMWSIGTLGPSSSAVMSITVTITDTSSPIINTATVSSATADPVPGNNSSTATVVPSAPSPSPTPSVTSTPTPTPIATSRPGNRGGGIISPPGITILNGGSSNGSNSGWHYTSNDSPAHTSPKQAQIAQPIPPVPTQDPIMCLQTNGIAALNFSDVQVSNDQTKAQFLTSILNRGNNKRLIQGYDAQMYGVGKVLTRFELTKIALQSNCLQTDQLHKNTLFSDVPHDNSEMSLIIGTAQSLGIVNGKDGKFYPNQAVTYGEMSKILLGSGFYFAQHNPAITYPASFTGITDESFRQYAEYAVRLGLVSLDNGSFPQNRPIYRDTMLQVLSRYVSYLKNITITN